MTTNSWLQSVGFAQRQTSASSSLDALLRVKHHRDVATGESDAASTRCASASSSAMATTFYLMASIGRARGTAQFTHWSFGQFRAQGRLRRRSICGSCRCRARGTDNLNHWHRADESHLRARE